MKALFRFMDWPLRAKMAALLVVTSLLPLGITTWIDIREARQRLLDNTAALLAARGDQLVRGLDTFNRGYERSAARIAHLPNVVKFCQARLEDADRDKPGVRTVLEVWPASDANISGVAILDLSGTVKVTTEDPLIGLDLSHHGHVQKALRGVAVISDIHLAEPQIGNTPTIAYLVPVPGTDGKPAAIAMLCIRATALWDVMKASNELAGPDSFAVLFDHQGIRIGHTYNADIVFHPAGRLDPAMINALVAERRFGEKTRLLLDDVRAFPEQLERALSKSPDQGLFRGFAPVNQKWNYGIARRFETVPWTVFYMIPEQSLTAQIAQMTREKTLFAGVIMLIALLAGALFAAVILKPIGSLSAATKLIAGGNWAARVEDCHADELGRLGASFNSMAEQIKAQSTALQDAHDELESLFESLPGLYLVLTPDLRIVAASDAYLKATMTTREGLVGRGLFEMFPDNPSDPHATGESNLRASLGHVLQNAIPHTMAIQKYDIRRTDGVFEKRYWSPINSPVLGVDHKVKYIVHRVEDVTEFVRQTPQSLGDPVELRARMERMEAEIFQSSQKVQEINRQLEMANKELEAFSYSVSHDLRAPLRAVDGFSQAVLEDYGSQLPEEGRRYLQTIREGAQRMGMLIDDLLTFSRLSRAPMNKQEVNTGQLVHTILDDSAFRPEGRQIDLRIGNLPACEGDPALLRQVWINLLSNALKYTRKREASVVEIGCEPAAEGNIFFVRDNGAGFDMRYADKLFGVFQRLHRAEDYEGTGVGLALVQRIIHRHGGRVWAEAAVDHGATFYFTLKGNTKL